MIRNTFQPLSSVLFVKVYIITDRSYGAYKGWESYFYKQNAPTVHQKIQINKIDQPRSGDLYIENAE